VASLKSIDMKKKNKKKVESTPVVASEPKKLTITSAGIVNGQFQVLFSDGSVLDGVDEIATKKVGYGSSLYVNIFCKVDSIPATPSLPISQEFSPKK
jgi:hypothetical protein